MSSFEVMKIPCKNCKGTGRTFDHTDGIVTLGVGYFFQLVAGKDKKCWKCNGKGKIKIKLK